MTDGLDQITLSGDSECMEARYSDDFRNTAAEFNDVDYDADSVDSEADATPELPQNVVAEQARSGRGR